MNHVKKRMCVFSLLSLSPSFSSLFVLFLSLVPSFCSVSHTHTHPGCAQVKGRIVRASPYTACGPVENGEQLSGHIALALRGDCMFAAKARRLQEAEAIGVIFIGEGPQRTHTHLVTPVRLTLSRNVGALPIRHISLARMVEWWPIGARTHTRSVCRLHPLTHKTSSVCLRSFSVSSLVRYSLRRLLSLCCYDG